MKSFAKTDRSFTVFDTNLVGVIKVMITAPPSWQWARAAGQQNVCEKRVQHDDRYDST